MHKTVLAMVLAWGGIAQADYLVGTWESETYYTEQGSGLKGWEFHPNCTAMPGPPAHAEYDQPIDTDYDLDYFGYGYQNVKKDNLDLKIPNPYGLNYTVETITARFWFNIPNLEQIYSIVNGNSVDPKFMTLEIYQDMSSVIGPGTTFGKRSIKKNEIPAVNQWIYFDVPLTYWADYKVEIVCAIRSIHSGGSDYKLLFDKVEWYATPEPVSLVLLGFGSLLVLRRKRDA